MIPRLIIDYIIQIQMKGIQSNLFIQTHTNKREIKKKKKQ